MTGAIALASAKLLARDGAAILLMARRRDGLDQCRADLIAAIPGARVEIHTENA